MVKVAESTFGKMNVMFNNAGRTSFFCLRNSYSANTYSCIHAPGIMHMDDDNAVTTEEKVWDLTFNVNVKGVFFG